MEGARSFNALGNARDYSLGHFILDRENIHELPIIAIRPNMRTCCNVD